ncbi:Pilin [Leminorella richardii]|uniref:Pilin n=1 Tax=Leminorella richardii TaxID=158841 RepID=A0A2X4URG5_9GAMM|nr:prepilin peptidase-dependent pilin [Leminorella richardii]SQI42456.1 Pilin [Leminorella richardii]
MNTQSGFTLFELMIAIAIIAILTAVGVPAYQGYVQKAALTDMLQAMVPYKTAVELCALEQGALTSCQQGSSGIPGTRTTRYVSQISVTAGAITLVGQNALEGLSVTLTPQLNSTTGDLNWQRTCSDSQQNARRLEACNDVFRFDGGVSRP